MISHVGKFAVVCRKIATSCRQTFATCEAAEYARFVVRLTRAVAVQRVCDIIYVKIICSNMLS